MCLNLCSAQNQSELSFEEGDVLYIISKQSQQQATHILCRKGTTEGLVPSSILQNRSSIEFPMHEAAKRGNIAFVKELISARVSVNTLDRAGNSALHWASRGGHLEVVKVLLLGKPVLSLQNKLGDTCLHSAAWGGHKEVLEFLLLQDGIEDVVGIRNNDGKTAYQVAKNPACGALLQPSRYAEPREQELAASGADPYDSD